VHQQSGEAFVASSIKMISTMITLGTLMVDKG
jgi:hypothetical protein